MLWHSTHPGALVVVTGRVTNVKSFLTNALFHLDRPINLETKGVWRACLSFRMWETNECMSLRRFVLGPTRDKWDRRSLGNTPACTIPAKAVFPHQEQQARLTVSTHIIYDRFIYSQPIVCFTTFCGNGLNFQSISLLSLELCSSSVFSHLFSFLNPLVPVLLIPFFCLHNFMT